MTISRYSIAGVIRSGGLSKGGVKFVRRPLKKISKALIANLQKSKLIPKPKIQHEAVPANMYEILIE
jgi:hypothetical protein